MSNSNRKEALANPKNIFRREALEQYGESKQNDVWPHLKLPGYLFYLWLLLLILFLIALVIGISLYMELVLKIPVF